METGFVATWALFLLGWGIGLLGLGGAVIGLAMRLFHRARQQVEEASKESERIKEESDAKINRFAQMSVGELGLELARIFGAALELSAVTEIAETDPDRYVKLYGFASAYVTTYLGETNMKHIDRYFGKDYVLRWCETAYRLLENSGAVAKICDRQFYSQNVVADLQMSGFIPESKKV